MSSTITDMAYQYAGLDDFKNEIVVVCHPRAVSASDQDTLWELEDEVRVGAGKTRTVNAKYQDGSDNRIGGKNVTVTDVVFSEGDGTIKLDARANSAALEITNEGSVGCYFDVVHGARPQDHRLWADGSDGQGCGQYRRLWTAHHAAQPAFSRQLR